VTENNEHGKEHSENIERRRKITDSTDLRDGMEGHRKRIKAMEDAYPGVSSNYERRIVKFLFNLNLVSSNHAFP